MLNLPSWALARTPRQRAPQVCAPAHDRRAGTRRPPAGVLAVCLCLLALAGAVGTFAGPALLAWCRENTQSSGLTAQSPLPQRVAAMSTLVSDAAYGLGVQPRVMRVWGLKIEVLPQTPDPQRTLEEANRISVLAFDQPYIEQDVEQIRRAYQDLQFQAARYAALAQKVQVLDGTATPSVPAPPSYTPNYAPMASWLDMIKAELEALAEPQPASVPETASGPG